KSKLNAPFALYCQLRQEINALVHAAHGSVFDTITTSTFTNSKVVIPTPELIAAFERLAAPVFLRILSNTDDSRTLATLRDISRGRSELGRGEYQKRARQVVVRVRLDFGGSPHRNPDGEEIGSPHLHIYREGFGDKWAIPLPADRFPRITNLRSTLDDFMQFCNITLPPNIESGLF